MAEIKTTVLTGGLGRTSANTDKWVGLIYIPKTALPSGINNYDVKSIAKLKDLEDLGITATNTDNSEKALWYHVSEFFRLSPTGYMKILFGEADTHRVANIGLLLNAENRLRLIGILNMAGAGEPLSMTSVTEIQSYVDALLLTEKTSCRVVYSAYQGGFSDVFADYPEFTTASNNRVQVDIAQDLTDGSLAKTLVTTGDKQCGAIGTILGMASRLSVHQKSSWVEKGSIGWETVGFGNGETAEGLSQSEVDDLLSRGYKFARKYPHSTNSYFAGDRMACATTDDYASLNFGRVMDKAVTLVYQALFPYLDAPTYINADGTIKATSIEDMHNAAYNAIQNNMIAGRSGSDVELSINDKTGMLDRNSIFINPNQNVLSTETVIVEIRLIPVGSTSVIEVQIGFNNPAL